MARSTVRTLSRCNAHSAQRKIVVQSSGISKDTCPKTKLWTRPNERPGLHILHFRMGATQRPSKRPTARGSAWCAVCLPAR